MLNILLQRAVKHTGGSLGRKPTDLLQLAGLSAGPLQFLIAWARELHVYFHLLLYIFGAGPSRTYSLYALRPQVGEP